MASSRDQCLSQYLIRVLSRSFHRRPIKPNRRHELKRRPIQVCLGGSGGYTPQKIEIEIVVFKVILAIGNLGVPN